ncbi:MAG: enoyl-CoA hydratase-related protein [Deltaproteobacteria bacterium]|jgi:enoyl-CoA hydratase/carnithine racemase|nr:enoyl-CoA hydratase-related protein [Deltaproteobacteria bacterium]MCW8893351.1 enoyl-CoA hydratase-related protein [Deltaproteobacteria bacterium]MCW9050361.1 enoyl-CoA hydratase-related protein [Deltaproteobacteria bacterium]
MATDLILTRKENQIGFITLNRPEAMNTFIPEFADQLDQALWAMEKDDDVRVIVINAAGKHFCTGISLDQFKNKTHQEYRKLLYGIDAFYHTLAMLNKPTIASVQGFALANGAGLSFACDMTVAAEGATFGTTAINVGLICLGPAAPMVKIIGKKKTMEMVLTGDMINAAEAEKLGLVNKVVADEDLEAETLKLAEKLVSKSPIALRIGKEGLKRLQDVPYHQGLDSMDDLFATLCATQDAEEGVKAFLEKRAPNWKEC